MKVVCVTLQDFTNGLGNKIGKVMDIGDEFRVVGELIGYGKNGLRIPCYDLEPWAHTDHVFDQRNFSPLTGIDETELVTEEFEEKYCVPV